MTTILNTSERADIWTALAANVDPALIQWRQNGRPKGRDGKFFAPFVAYIEANTVRERLDAVVPGEWDLTLELLPPQLTTGGDGEANDAPVAFKARLQVLGVIREDVGAGKDYKQASTDATKRVAVRFGIGHELYTDYEITWVQVDGDGKYAKALEDPSVVFARKQGKPAPVMTTRTQDALAAVPKPALVGKQIEDALDMEPVARGDDGEPLCPKCGGRTWDNRLTKRNPKAPNFKCRDRACDGVIWPEKGEKAAASAKPGRESDDGPYDNEPPF